MWVYLAFFALLSSCEISLNEITQVFYAAFIAIGSFTSETSCPSLSFTDQTSILCISHIGDF